MDITKIRDYTERTWFIGTDVLSREDVPDEDNIDLNLMENGSEATMHSEWCAMYQCSYIPELIKEYKNVGYSDRFCEIILEGQRRGYSWIIFDRDLQTKVKL